MVYLGTDRKRFDQFERLRIVGKGLGEVCKILCFRLCQPGIVEFEFGKRNPVGFRNAHQFAACGLVVRSGGKPFQEDHRRAHKFLINAPQARCTFGVEKSGSESCVFDIAGKRHGKAFAPQPGGYNFESGQCAVARKVAVQPVGAKRSYFRRMIYRHAQTLHVGGQCLCQHRRIGKAMVFAQSHKLGVDEFGLYPFATRSGNAALRKRQR